MEESGIQDYWDDNPCGDGQVGKLNVRFDGDYERFFAAYDAYRYKREGHILKCLDRFDFRGKKVLEVGLGQGADSEQLIRRGARWSGLDLTKASVERVKKRMEVRDLDYDEIKQGSVLQMPFEDESFDIVFSHGVLHHVPEIRAAQREIKRVLRKDGRLIVMVYAKNSLNYWVSIAVIRRLGLLAARMAPSLMGDKVKRHVELSRERGLWDYLKIRNFIHRNTDGPDNPYSKVYTVRTLKQDFAGFEVATAFKAFMHAPPLPVTRLPGSGLVGWHLWAELKPVTNAERS